MRSTPLTPQDIEAFFDAHLPYRLTMLRAHRDRVKNEPKSIEHERDLSTCAYEAGLIVCRVLLRFLGLRVDRSTGKLQEFVKYDKEGDEVKVVDLDPRARFATLADVPATADLLARGYAGASKATAHLTDGTIQPFHWNELHPLVDEIERLLKLCLYDPTGHPMKSHRK